MLLKSRICVEHIINNYKKFKKYLLDTTNII